MSSKTSRIADLARAPTLVYLPACKNGCGEMLTTTDGYMCPICKRFKNYHKGERHP